MLDQGKVPKNFEARIQIIEGTQVLSDSRVRFQAFWDNKWAVAEEQGKYHPRYKPSAEVKVLSVEPLRSKR